MARFRQAAQRPLSPDDRTAARRAPRQLSRMGRTRAAPNSGDRGLARGADLDRVRDPAGRVHRCRRSDGHLRSAGTRVRRHDPGRPTGTRIDLVYRRVLINDILARPDECAALVDAYERRAVCVANTFRCKLPHKKAFFAVLTDPANAEDVLADGARGDCGARAVDASARRRRHREGRRRDAAARTGRRERDTLVLKPNDEYGGKGVLLGWEAGPGRVGCGARRRARRDPRLVDRAGADPDQARSLPAVRRVRRGDRQRTCSSISRRSSFAAGCRDI